MLIVCTKKFGNFVPGDELEIPDGAVYDRQHFKAVKQPEPPKKETK